LNPVQHRSFDLISTARPGASPVRNTSLGEQLRVDGVVCVRDALDAGALQLALAAYEWSLAHPSRAANTYAGGEGTFYQDLANPRAWSAYSRLLSQSPVADIVAGLWGGPDVWFMYEQVFLKEGGESRRTPWHQDSSYLPVDGSQLAVMWISFDPVKREDSLEFVRGSHCGVMYDGSRFDPADDTAPIYGDGSLPRLPNIEAERDRWDIVSWAIEPGDVLVFHPGMLHGGAPTHRGQRRRTLSLRFFGGDARYALRPGMSGRRRSVDDPEASVFAQLPATHVPGDPLRHPLFPKVRPRASEPTLPAR
jgi:ectoine hydroxylase-related dioxygenase (phytanoyl-CoA dioxygenase family)